MGQCTSMKTKIYILIYRSTRKHCVVLFIRQVWQDSRANKEILNSDTANFCKSAKSAKIQTMVRWPVSAWFWSLDSWSKVWFGVVSERWPDWDSGWHLSQQFTLPLFKIGCHVIFCLSSVLDRRPSIGMNFLGIFMVPENHFSTNLP